MPTDFVLHHFHFYPEVDFYYLPQHINEATLNSLPTCNKILITGIPISPAFWSVDDKINIYRQLNFSPDKTTILISFGGSGLKADLHIQTLRALFRLNLPLQFILISGKNKSFETKMREIVSTENRKDVRVFGFVNNMAHLMTITDLFIGKAGGVSLSEALAKGLPIGIIDSLPGQEKYNIEFITSNHLGRKLKHFADMKDWGFSLLSKDNLSDWKKRAVQFGKPLSGFTIANHILSNRS